MSTTAIDQIFGKNPPRRPKPGDVLIWPDGTWCERSELDDYGWMSDDYRVLYEGNWEWFEFFEQD